MSRPNKRAARFGKAWADRQPTQTYYLTVTVDWGRLRRGVETARKAMVDALTPAMANLQAVVASFNSLNDDARRALLSLEQWTRQERFALDRWESEGGAL